LLELLAFIIMPHRPYYARRCGLLLQTTTSVICRSLCQYFGLSTVVSHAKMAEPIEVPFGLRTRVDGWVQIPMGRGNFEEEGVSHCKV